MAERHWFREYFEAILIAGVFLAFTNSYLIKTFYIPSGSMENTLLIGDHLFVNRFIFGSGSGLERSLLPARELQRGDIVIFRAPENPENDLVKRLIGLPGDTIQLVEKRLYVNGQEVKNQPYAANRDGRIFFDPGADAGGAPGGSSGPRPNARDFFGPFTVPPEEFFFLGDNRDNSHDSRFWGTAPRRYIKGRAFLIYWSFGGETSDGQWKGFGNKLAQIGHTLAGFFTETRWSRTFHLPR
jgi:signal peptidase I